MRIFFLLLFFNSLFSFSQTLVMNEVSNGPSGNMEYVEFVVVDTNVVYNCVGITTPPCIDIRGWIFDDNSGYHGASGVAAGCIRFSNDPFWSCIPVGTIILIYNNIDPNSSIPADDLLMTDGNCRLVIPVNNTTLFDQNPSTPGAIACSYPAAGWVAGGNWNTTLLANGGDCARIVNLAGCEIFSVCWGAASTNTLIYFSGSAQDRVYSFHNLVSNTASNVANWVNGCADVTACGINQQTPGSPNNPANLNWINSMNNNCSPIQPLTLNSNTITGACPCSASATVSTLGSLPPFSYTWSPAPVSGQGTSVAGGLCTGTYTCFVKSNTTKCTETIVVTVSNNNALNVNATNTGTYCSGSSIQLSSSAANSYTWSGPSGFNSSLQNPTISPANTSMSGIYTVQVSVGSCTAEATTSVSVLSLPVATISNNGPICEGETLLISGGVGLTYLWNGPNGYTSSSQSNTLTNVSLNNSGAYTLIVIGANTCSSQAISNITINSLPSIIANGSNPCVGSDLILTASGGSLYSWIGPQSYTSTLQNPTINNATLNNSGIYTVVASDNNNCSNTTTLQINVLSLPIALANGTNVCEGSTLNLSSSGGDTYTWIGPNGYSSNDQNPIIAQSTNSNTGVYIVTVANSNCTNTTSVNIEIHPKPIISATSSNSIICSDSTCLLFSNGNGNSYNWSGPSGFISNLQNPVIQSISESNEGIYTVTTTNTLGCIASSTVFVTVDLCECTPFIPEGFSPNDDGVHDALEITCLEGRKTKLEIYNRWGNLVFKEDNYQNNWKGKSNYGIQLIGDDLPSGTYYYIIKIDDEEKAKTGFITLWR